MFAVPPRMRTLPDTLAMVTENGARVFVNSASDGRGTQVAVHGLATDPKLLGQHGLPFTGGGALPQLVRLGGGERGLAPGVDAALFGRGDALALAFQDQGAFELGEGAHDGQQEVEPLRMLLALPYLGFLFSPSLTIALVLGFVASAGYSASLPLQERLVGATGPEMRGQAFGLYSTGLRSATGDRSESRQPRISRNAAAKRRTASTDEASWTMHLSMTTELVAVGLVQPHSRDLSTATSGNSSGEP